MANYINDIRKINNLINDNKKDELIEFLKNNKVDLNYFEKTTSPLKVGFNNFFKTKDFGILSILIMNGINIFEDEFIFKLLKYRKHDEFLKVYELRKEDIDNYIRNGKKFIDVLKSYAGAQTVVYVDSIINRKSENEKIYDSLINVLLAKDKDYLIHHAESLKALVPKSMDFLVKGIVYQNTNAMSANDFNDAVALLKEVYDIKDIFKGNDQDNSMINVISSLNYFLFQNKKSDNRENVKKVFINIIDDFYSSFTPEQVTRKNKDDMLRFFTFQNNIQSYLSRKETSDELKILISEKLTNYKERDIYFPAYNMIFKENLMHSTVNKMNFFEAVNFSREDLQYLLKMPEKHYNSNEEIKEIKELMFISLLVNSRVKQHKILNEFMEDEKIFFLRKTPLLEFDGKKYFPDDLINKVFLNKITVLEDVLKRIKDNESYFIQDRHLSPDLVTIYVNNIGKNIESKNLKIIFDIFAKEGFDLKDVSGGTFGHLLLKNGILRNNQKYKLLTEYLKFNPDISANPTLALDIVQRVGAFNDVEKVFELCLNKAFFTQDNFPESVVSNIQNNNNVDSGFKIFIEKAYMTSIVSQSVNENAVVRRKRM